MDKKQGRGNLNTEMDLFIQGVFIIISFMEKVNMFGVMEENITGIGNLIE
jgi:hypothetical protein